MIDLLTGIVDFLGSIIIIIGNTFSSIIWVITSIPKFTATFAAIFAYCPTPLLVWLEVCLALTVLFAIINLIK